MTEITQFEDIKSWQRGRELTNNIYTATKKDDFSSDYELKNQIRGASVSIMSNIAEGFHRDGNDEFIQFLSQAKGSAGEIQAQLYVAFDQSYISEDEFDELYELTEEVIRLLSGFMKYLEDSNRDGIKYE